MLDLISESDMNFVADNVFHIEKSDLNRKAGKGIRTVEFVRVKGDQLLFVEAKKRLPEPGVDPNKENAKSLQTEIDKVFDKFIHSLHLLAAVKVGVREETFPIDFATSEKLSLQFILVVKEHDKKWCDETQTTLKEKLKKMPPYFKKIWGPTVWVLTHADAVKRGIAYPPTLLPASAADVL